MPLTEFELIRRFFTHPARHAVLGVGDDAAIVRARRGMELVVTTDMLVAGRISSMTPIRASSATRRSPSISRTSRRWGRRRAGRRSRSRCRRSIRAGSPAFTRGFMRLARRHRVDLVGGDTTRGPLNICVQVMGEVPRGRALRRDGARAGDDVWVSGTLGDAALALAARRGRLRRRANGGR